MQPPDTCLKLQEIKGFATCSAPPPPKRQKRCFAESLTPSGFISMQESTKMKGYNITCCCFCVLPQMPPKFDITESSRSPRFARSLQDFRAEEHEGTWRCWQRPEVPQVPFTALQVNASKIIKIKPFDSIKPASEHQSLQTVGNVTSTISIPVSHFVVASQGVIPLLSSRSRAWQSASDGFLAPHRYKAVFLSPQ